MDAGSHRISFPVRDYDLAATLSSGQAFRWRQTGAAWVGVVGDRWVRLEAGPESIEAEVCETPGDWNWLRHYLQAELDLEPVLRAFPDDEPLQRAARACRGLRLLRQDPWECLASFILSSTKQIIQIQQVVDALCRRFGAPVRVPAGAPPAFSFPTAATIAAVSESELRACKMGFRAPYLLAAARQARSGDLDLAALRQLPMATARERLMAVPGVGRKIADCVLLFAYGFPAAFPVDVWVMRALRQLYFPRRRVSPKQLGRFAETHFGPHAGYAQQYLFHYMRTRHNGTGVEAEAA